MKMLAVSVHSRRHFAAFISPLHHQWALRWRSLGWQVLHNEVTRPFSSSNSHDMLSVFGRLSDEFKSHAVRTAHCVPRVSKWDQRR